MTHYLSFCLSVVVLLAAPAAAQPAPDVAGTWSGALQVPGGQLTIVFHVTEAADGTLAATMDSPDQGATGIPVSDAALNGGTLRLTVSAIGGVYEGRLSEDASTLDGTWRQSGQALPLTLTREGTAAADEAAEQAAADTTDLRPQEPQRPFPYREEEVRFEGAGGTLVGTLTMPVGEGPFPAAVLVSGSGPQERDATVMGHRLFLVLSDHLTRRGIAVLRYDERGVGASEGDFATATTQDFAADAARAVDYLAQRPGLDGDEIGVIGHSEGGLVAPLVAQQRPGDVAFVVLMAAPGLPGEDLLLLQGRAISEAGGAPPAAVDAQRRIQERVFDIVRTTPDSSAAADALRAALAEAGVTGEQAEQQVRSVLSPWFRAFLAYDPAPALRTLDVPALVLNGTKDLQVPPDENLEAIEAALVENGEVAYEIMRMPGLNHLFQTADTGLPTEYARLSETMSPTAMQAVADWILGQVGRP